MDVGDDRHIAPALAQTFDDVLKVARIFDSRRGDPDDFTTGVRQFNRLLDRRLSVHRVAGNHRLDSDRVITTDADVAYLHLTRLPTVIMEWINAIVHEIANVRSLDQSRNALRLMASGCSLPAIAPRVGRAFF